MSLQEKLEQMYDEGHEAGHAKGREEAMEENVRQLMKNGNMSEAAARKLLGLPPKDRLNLDHVGR